MLVLGTNKAILNMNWADTHHMQHLPLLWQLQPPNETPSTAPFYYFLSVLLFLCKCVLCDD